MARRVVRSTKSGRYIGTRKVGKAVKRISNREHRRLGTLQARNRAAAHKRKRSR